MTIVYTVSAQKHLYSQYGNSFLVVIRLSNVSCNVVMLLVMDDIKSYYQSIPFVYMVISVAIRLSNNKVCGLMQVHLKAKPGSLTNKMEISALL